MSGELPRIDVGEVRPSHDAAIDNAADSANSVDHAALADLVARTDGQLDVVLTTDFDDFYRRTHTPVARALAMTLRDVDLATDSIDEAFARAYQRWDRVSRYDNPGGWVYRVALNHATSRLRQIRRRIDRNDAASLSVEHIEHLYADPDIGAALATLSVSHRSVVVCRLLLGWSEKDTAAALDVRPGTVKSRLSRALAQLQARLIHLRPEES